MANLTGSSVATTYDRLLNLSSTISTTAQTVTDGLGGATGLELTTTNVNIASGFTFTINGNSVYIDDLGLGSLVDPDADRIIFWDDGASAVGWLTAGSGLDLTATTLSVPDLTVAGDSGSTAMTPGDTLTVAGGTGITTAMSGDTLTVTQDTITSVGTITSGTWTATAIGVAYGGTGQTTYTDGQLLIGNSTGNTLTKAALTGGTGITVTNGSGTITLASDDANIDHDALSNFVANEHIDWTSTTSNISTTGSAGVGQLNADNIRIDGNTISSTDAAGNIVITPDTTGDLILDGLNWPQADGTTGYILQTNGAGQLSWVANAAGAAVGDANEWTAIQSFVITDTGTTSVVRPAIVGHMTTSTAAAGFGVGLQFNAEVADGEDLPMAYIDAVSTDVAAGTEDFDLSFKVATAGAAPAQVALLNNAAFYANGLQLGGTGATCTSILDEDTLSSNSAVALATQQSIKAYVDTEVAGASGGLIQVVNADYLTHSSVTATIAFDDTIPQNTEGTEILTLAITPTSSTNNLIIDVRSIVTGSASGQGLVLSLFQDSTADALNTTKLSSQSVNDHKAMNISHFMAAGTTSATTFKLRLAVTGGTAYLNGGSGGRQFGGITETSITISEVA